MVFTAFAGEGRWFDPKQRSVVLGGQHVEKTVRPLTHVADSLAQFPEQRLPVELFPLVVEVDSLEMTGARHLALPHAAGEDVALPLGETIAGVKGQP